MVMKIVKDNNTAMGQKKTSLSAMTQEDVSAFKGYDLIQQDFMQNLRGYDADKTDKEVNKMTTELLKEQAKKT